MTTDTIVKHLGLNEQHVPAYPSRMFDPDARWFQELLEDRIDGLMDKLEDEMIENFLVRIYAEIGENFGGKSKLVKTVTKWIHAGLIDWKL